MDPPRIAQIIDDTEAEGPGRRFAVWVQGCPLRCPGCCNPEMLRFDVADARVLVMTPAEVAARAIARLPAIEGVSLLGGEPFAQPEGCAELAEQVRAAGLSVMVYSGFTRAELDAREDSATRRLLAACDLLVDGPYLRERPEPRRRWIGSANQELHFLSPRYRPDDPRFLAANTVEIRLRRGELLVNGWPALAGRVAKP